MRRRHYSVPPPVQQSNRPASAWGVTFRASLVLQTKPATSPSTSLPSTHNSIQMAIPLQRQERNQRTPLAKTHTLHFPAEPSAGRCVRSCPGCPAPSAARAQARQPRRARVGYPGGLLGSHGFSDVIVSPAPSRRTRRWGGGGEPNFIVPPADLPARPQDARGLSAGGGGGSRFDRALAPERRTNGRREGGKHHVR